MTAPTPRGPIRTVIAAGVAVAVAVTPLGAADTMFISSFIGGDIHRFDLPSSTDNIIVAGLSLPEDGACSPTSGLIYFPESNFDLVTRWDQSGGGATNIIPTAGVILGPEGLTFDAAGNMFINTRDRGGTQGAWRLDGGDPANAAVQVVAPYTSFGEGAELVVAGPHKDALLLVARGEVQVWISEPPGAALKLFIDTPAFPANSILYGIVTNGCGEVFVSFASLTSGPSEVYRFDPEGKFIEAYVTGLAFAGYLDFDSDGFLYVADANADAIYKVAPDKTRTLFANVLDPVGIAICRERRIPTCGTITCDVGGPYKAECAGALTCLTVDASKSTTTTSSPITYQFSSNCPGAKFDDPTKVNPQLCVETGGLGCSLNCEVSVTVTAGTLSASCKNTVTIEDTLPPVLDGCALRPALPPAPASSSSSPPRSTKLAAAATPRAPASPSSACSGASSARVVVDCGKAADACDPAPKVEARVVLTKRVVTGGVCTRVTEEVAVACGEILDLRRLAPPCAASAPAPPKPPKPPKSPASPPSSPGPPGPRVLEGEEIRLEVTATDACGHVSAPCIAEAVLCAPKAAKCASSAACPP